MPNAVGRLKPGLTVEQAQARLTAMATELRRDFPTEYPPQAQWTIEIQPLQEALVGRVRPMLLVLLGAVMLIVFIVSLNVANLLLARASGRQQEIAVRLALGASRSRMVRQMLTESVLLSLMGGLAGVLTAFSTLDFILRFVPSSIPRLHEVRIDWVVLAFALLISLLTGLLFGLAPAVQSIRSDLSLRVREGARGSGYSSKTGRLRDALIVSELAFAVVLMVGAGLLLRTLRELLEQNPGFNPIEIVAANIWLPIPNDPKADPYLDIARQTTFNRDLLRRMWAAVRADGVIAVEDADFDGLFCDPANAGFDFYATMYRQVCRRNGGDPAIGRKLYRYFGQAGISDPQFRLVQGVTAADEVKVLAVLTLEATTDAITSAGLARVDEVAAALADLRAFAATPGTMIGDPRTFQVWARRPRYP